MSKPTEDNGQALLSLASARASTYAFLSGSFTQPPTPEGIASLRSEAFLNSAAETFSEETISPLRQFAQAPEPVEALQRLVRQEFMELFKVPGGKYVTPYESVFRYTREIEGQQVKGLLMGQSAIDVQKWYRLAALEISPEFKDLPDHIALELNYLAQLCAKEQEFAAGGDRAKLHRAWEMERDFLAAHVVSWAGALSDKIREKSDHPYFQAVAGMLAEFTCRDLATLEDVLGPSSSKPVPAYKEPPQ